MFHDELCLIYIYIYIYTHTHTHKARPHVSTYETLSYVNHVVAKNTRSIYTTVTNLKDTELEKSILKIHLQINLRNRRV